MNEIIGYATHSQLYPSANLVARQLQVLSETTRWNDETERTDEFIGRAAARRHVTPDDIRQMLEAGNEINYTGEAWYTMIRYAPITQSAPVVKEVVIKCGCGHSMVSHLVMNTSRGTSCPNCFDRMSD